MFTTVEQVKKIITNFLNNTGRGGFMTGVVSSISPLKIKAGARLEIPEENLYITDSCIGLVINLRHKHNYSEAALNNGVVLREALQVGDGVLLLCRPRTVDGSKYIVLDRIQPYKSVREVDGL